MVILGANSVPLSVLRPIAFFTVILRLTALTYAKPAKTSGNPVATRRRNVPMGQQKDQTFVITGGVLLSELLLAMNGFGRD